LLAAFSGLRAQPLNEYQAKASYLYNFIKFVEWPEGAFPTAKTPVVVCVIEEKLLQRSLEETARGHRLEARTVVTRQVHDARRVDGCHVLFIGSRDPPRVASILRQLNSPGVLTVSEVDGFTSMGGAVNLRLEGLRIRLVINTSAVELQQLRISPRLMGLVRVVRE